MQQTLATYECKLASPDEIEKPSNVIISFVNRKWKNGKPVKKNWVDVRLTYFLPPIQGKIPSNPQTHCFLDILPNIRSICLQLKTGTEAHPEYLDRPVHLAKRVREKKNSLRLTLMQAESLLVIDSGSSHRLVPENLFADLVYFGNVLYEHRHDASRGGIRDRVGGTRQRYSSKARL